MITPPAFSASRPINRQRLQHPSPRHRPPAIPDLSREALQVRLHIPNPRTAVTEQILDLPLLRPAGRQIPPPGPPRNLCQRKYAPRTAERYRRQSRAETEIRLTGTPADLLDALTAPLLQSLIVAVFEMDALSRTALAEFHNATKPGLPAGNNTGEWRLLPLSGYEEFRARMDRQLAAHAALRERWLPLLIQRLQSQNPAADQAMPAEEELRRRWQARLELRAAPTLSEYVAITKDDALTGQRREAYHQAALACRNANHLKEYQGIHNRTGCAPWK